MSSLLPLNNTLMAFPSPSDSVQWTWCALRGTLLGGILWEGISALLSGQVLGLQQELCWQISAFPAKENSAGIDSFPLLPRFVLLVPGFGRWAVGWSCASLPWETELRFCKFREEIWRRESKTGSVSNQSLLMLELPNSVFTHQGLTLMVIYSHFLVNN